jgi:hypothetical protein
LCTGKHPDTNLLEVGDMSGCYDNYDHCGSENSWDYNDCYKPRRHRRHHRQYDNCWDYSRCS